LREVTLDSKTFKKMPYSTTTVSWQRTKGEIDGLLYEHGIDKIQWTQEGDQIQLIFAMKVEVMNVEKLIAFKFEPVRIFAMTGRKGRRTKTEMKNVAWRLFWWHLKSKLEAVKYGLSSVEVELMSNIIHKLPDGSEATVGETMQQIIAEDRLNGLALEDRRGAKAVEVESRVIE